MKYTLTLLGMMVCTSACWPAQRIVTVCLGANSLIDFHILTLAENDASRILATAGVVLHWKVLCKHTQPEGSRPDLTMIEMAWLEHVPANIEKGAYASARPFQTKGIRVDLYSDRIARIREPLMPAILGHVLAHEIGHILLQHDGHTHDGLMKANWSASEQLRMARQRLAFDVQDADCMRRNLDEAALTFAVAR